MEEIYQQIESPLASFNNFILTISEQLSEIYEYNLAKNNDIIFDNDSINLFGYIKFQKDKNNKIQLYIKKAISSNNLNIIEKTISNYTKLCSIFYRYLFIFNDI